MTPFWHSGFIMRVMTDQKIFIGCGYLMMVLRSQVLNACLETTDAPKSLISLEINLKKKETGFKTMFVLE